MTGSERILYNFNYDKAISSFFKFWIPTPTLFVWACHKIKLRMVYYTTNLLIFK